MMFHFEFLQVPTPVCFWCSTNIQINLRSERYLEPFHVTSFRLFGCTWCMSMIRSFSVNTKNASKKIEALIRSMKFLSPKVALISINLLYGHAWKTVVISGLVLLVATQNCQISQKNGYAGLLVLPLLPLLNPWFFVEMQPAQVFSIGITLVDVHLN